LVFGVKLPFTVYEGFKRFILCTFLEVKHLDPSFIEIPLKSEHIPILLNDKKGSRRIYDYFIAQIKHRPVCEKKMHHGTVSSRPFQLVKYIQRPKNLLQKMFHYFGFNTGLYIESLALINTFIFQKLLIARNVQYAH
jgi:hypothetical protein